MSAQREAPATPPPRGRRPRSRTPRRHRRPPQGRERRSSSASTLGNSLSPPPTVRRSPPRPPRPPPSPGADGAKHLSPIYIYTPYIYIYPRMVYICRNLYIQRFVFVRVCTCVYNTYIYMCVYKNIHVCSCVRMHRPICIYIYIYI